MHFWGPFWLHAGPSRAQNIVFCKEFGRFYKVRFWSPKVPKTAPRTTKMAPESPVMAPDSTPRQTPIRVCTPKRFGYLKPPRYLKVSLSAMLATSWPSWHKRLYLRKPQFYRGKTIGYEKSWICDKKWKEKTAPGGEKNAHKKNMFFYCLFGFGAPQKPQFYWGKTIGCEK